MPTSVISEEALEAGRRFGTRETGAKKPAVQKPSVPKVKPLGVRAGRKPTFDPSKGFALSSQAADRLLASGFVKEGIPTGPGVHSPSKTLVTNPGTISTNIPVSEHSLYVPGPGTRPDQVSPSQEISNAAASLQALAQDTGTPGYASASTFAPTGIAPVAERNNPASEWNDDETEEDSGSRDNDDPNDASFGSRSTGRKKGKAQKSTGPARKRKSAVRAAPAKRSRLSIDSGLDGAVDESGATP